MHVLHIHSEKDVLNLDQYIKKGCHVFILIYMEGCGPCNATRPEWAKIDSALKQQYAKKDDLVVVDVNKNYLSKLKHIGQIDGFPTMKYISDYGKTIETYEDSSITKKDRSVSSFINWIESIVNNVMSTNSTSSPEHVYKRLVKGNKTRKNKTRNNKSNQRGANQRGANQRGANQRGGKWSRKYKLSINCKRPKGFSQKQYCKYGQNK